MAVLRESNIRVAYGGVFDGCDGDGEGEDEGEGEYLIGGSGGWWRKSRKWGVAVDVSSGSRRWKLRWQPQAAHFREVGSVVVAVGEGMNSPQPSTACPPKLAAWFFKHSLYVTVDGSGGSWWWRRRPRCLLSAPLVTDRRFKSFSASLGLVEEVGLEVKSIDLSSLSTL